MKNYQIISLTILASAGLMACATNDATVSEAQRQSAKSILMMRLDPKCSDASNCGARTISVAECAANTASAQDILNLTSAQSDDERSRHSAAILSKEAGFECLTGKTTATNPAERALQYSLREGAK